MRLSFRSAYMRKIPRWGANKDTWNLGGGGGKGKKDPQQVPHDARTPTTKGEDDRLFDFGRERSTTRIGGQQLHLHESPTKDNRRNKRKD